MTTEKTFSEKDHKDAWLSGKASRKNSTRAMNYPPEYPEELKDDYIFGYFNHGEDDYD